MNFLFPVNSRSENSRVSNINAKMHAKMHYIRKTPAVTTPPLVTAAPAVTVVSSTKKDSSIINKIIKAVVSK
jgi:hypothetical protein|uniref:Uncharacterized protein n=1 Tax=viral metagenome TaxID=1070528 RepID=A0A6C0EWT1_9ZZZZ